MTTTEIIDALHQGKTIYYQSTRNRVSVDMFGELTISDTETNSVRLAVVDNKLIGKPVEYFIYTGQKLSTSISNQLSLF